MGVRVGCAREGLGGICPCDNLDLMDLVLWDRVEDFRRIGDLER